MVFKHSIKNNEQFTHTSRKGNLLDLASGQQSLIEGTYDRVMTAGNKSCHIEGGTYTGAATPNCTFPAQCATIPVKRSHSDQGSYTLSVQGSQFRQISQNRDCQLRPYTGYGTQQILFFTPYRAVTQHFLQTSIYLTQLLLKPINMKLDSLRYWRLGCTQPVFLSNQHAHHLIPASDQSSKRLSLRIRKRTGKRADCLSKMSQNLSIQSIGFGQFAGGSGKISYLSGVDNHDRQTGNSQSRDHRKFQPTGCFKKHQSGMKLGNLFDKLLNTLLGIGNLPLPVRGTDSNIQPRLGNVDANEKRFLIHYNLLAYFIALPCTIRAWLALTTVRAFSQDGVATLAFLRSIVTQEVSVCHTTDNYD